MSQHNPNQQQGQPYQNQQGQQYQQQGQQYQQQGYQYPQGYQQAPVDPMIKVASNLKGLSVGYFVLGGITAFFSLFFLIYIFMGIKIQEESFNPYQYNGYNDPLADTFGSAMIVMGTVGLIIGELLAILMIVTGVKLRKRTGYTFAFVVSCIICLSFPFGTTLGVLSLIVLSKPETKQAFGR